MRGVALALVALVACRSKPAKEPPKPPLDPKDIPANVDRIANDVLADTGVPSASVAVISDGKLVYTHAYGKARLSPETPAKPEMRYSIGSISKQFTATAILLLAEDGKLTLDDPVGTYVPGLTSGEVVTLRQILTHTSGYPDYAPQDYIIPEWEKPITAQAILDRWARVPLDFPPGTKFQYSNTNFVIAGLVVEKVAGMPLVELLKQRVFGKLGMASVTDSDRTKLGEADPQGYFRRALGPLQPAPHEGPGWMYAAGELAMTAEDLAKWDLSLIDQGVLTPASYKQLETEMQLANGAGTRYGLGIGVTLTQGRRELNHSGEVSGFVSANHVMPDDKLAVVVLTNQDASGAAEEIAAQIRDVLLRATTAPSAATDAVVRALLEGLATHHLDRTKLTANLNAYFSDAAIDDYAKTLEPLGTIQSLEQLGSYKRGGMTGRRYKVKYETETLLISVYEVTDGKLEQFLIEKD